MSEKKESVSGSGKVYACKLCKKTFKQKCDYDKHANKKAPCISLAACEAFIVKKDEGGDSKKELTTFFKNCLDLLRDNEGLTGEKALRNLSYLLILKLLEPHFGDIIDIDNYEYDFSCFEEEDIEHNRARLLSCVRFSNLSKEKEDNIPNMMKYLWDIILSVHPSTKNIFLPDKKFDIQRQSTYKKIVDKLNRINLSSIENDILGDSYEEVIQYIMTGKVLGQFFTPHLIKKFMVGLIDPQIFSNGQIESCCDPTMGTGGFLIEYIRVIQEKAKLNDISLDWQFIKNGGLYGKELEPDTYQLAVSNMLISTGHMFEQLDRGDSIREPIEKKFDNLLVNPPFGIKGLKYDDFNYGLKEQYIPIKTDNAVSLFIQAIIFMLKIGGKCAIVLPDGQDLFSKTNATLVAVREYLMKTCDLKEIYLLPSGIFEHTTIKTCVFYFVKRREGSDVLRVKTQKKSNWEYEFSKTLMTRTVQFYDYNPYENIKNLLVEVPIEKIASNLYSLNYAEYMRDDVEEEQYKDSVIVKTLGEVCKFDIGGTPSRNKNEYYENGNNLWVSVRELNGGYIYDTKEKITDLGVQNSSVKLFVKDTVLFSFKLSIGKTAIVGNPLYTNEAIAGILSKNNSLLNNKYLYYYLTIQDFSKLGSGILGNGSLNKKSLEQLKIPIPSLELQREIVKYLDFIYERANKTSNEKIAELKQLNDFCLNNQRIFGKNVIKTVGEICDKIHSGKFNSKDCKISGKYPFYTNKVNNPEGYTDEYCFDYEKYFILIKDGGAGDKKYGEHIGLGKIFKVFGKSAGTSHQYALVPKKDFDYDYLYQYFKFIKNDIMDLAHYTTGLGCIKKSDIENLKIPIPSLERQQEIVAYCKTNDELIKQLEIEIENNKRQAEQFIKSIVNAQVQIEEKLDEE